MDIVKQVFLGVVGEGAFSPYVGEILRRIFHFGRKIVRVGIFAAFPFLGDLFTYSLIITIHLYMFALYSLFFS